ncbi:hypothetical protein COF42_17225 [Bacillus wiedmannii]|uniref:hypothetical protein n=1 Tax=Bacillus wiedmannii TaxID=1890302 RepID=UPI000BFE0363|nr:hypothetical protein [Bacillus wiedmannii]PHC86054.1 hypothetical protein COF42_17225 [Bacillus wiedmannii]
MNDEIIIDTDETGSVLKIEPTDDEGIRKFSVTIPKEVYEKSEVSIEWGHYIGEGYKNFIDQIIGVYMKDGILTIEGYVK